MKLYEISTEYNAFLEAVENGEIPEEAMTDTLESITAILEDKADAVACMIKNLLAEAEAIKAEADNLKARYKAKENRAEWLKNYLSACLQRSNIPKLETARNVLSFRKSEPVTFADENAFIAWAQSNRDDLLNYGKPTVNKTAIKKAIESGETFDGVQIEKKMNLQIK